MSAVFQLDALIEVLPKIIEALPITLLIGCASMLAGLMIGTCVGVAQTKRKHYFSWILSTYVSFFRGTPLMVQLFIFYYGLPQLIPFIADLNAIQAAIVVMSINAGAYISEVIRAAIASVPVSQFQAAKSVGMTHMQTMFHVILPQAFRIAIPSLGNTFISVIQGTSITFMLGVKDIMGIAKMNAAANYRFLETYLAVGLVYWLLTLASTHLNSYLEGHFSKGYARK